MFTKIEKFLLFENVQQAKNILKKLNLDPKKEQDFKDISKTLEKLPNLIGKFVDFKYNEGNDIEDIKRVLNWILTNRDSINKLPKNIQEYTNLENLEDDIEELKRHQIGNKFYKSLYSSMRNQVDKLNKEQRTKFDNLAISFMKLPEAKQKQFTPLKYFERNNVSINDFIKALENFVINSTGNNDLNNILNKLEKYNTNKYEILYNMNNVLVIESEDNDLVKEMGSQSWCIVYGSDSTRNAYFGPDTYNTQLIIYNFNVPSTDPNSMFGITIQPNGDVNHGACQNKSNHFTTREDIKKITGLPDSIFKPNEIKVKMFAMKTEIKYFISSIDRDKIFSFVELIIGLKDRLIKGNYIKEDDKELSNIIINTLKKVCNNTISNMGYIKSTFDNKSPQEIKDIITKYSEIKTLLTDGTFQFYDFLIATLNFKSKESAQFLFLYFIGLHHSNGSIHDYKIWLEKFLDEDFSRRYIIDYSNVLKLTEIDSTVIDNYLSIINMNDSRHFKTTLINVYDFVNDKVTKFIIDHPQVLSNSFTEYKKLYDENQLEKDEEPYDYFFNEDLYLVASVNFLDDEIYQDFILESIKNGHDQILNNICINAQINHQYDILDKYGKELSKLYEKSKTNPQTIPKENAMMIHLMLYKNGVLDYAKKFKETLGVKTSEEGIEYVVVSDFTSFDDILFKEEYFNNIQDIDHYYENYKDSQLSDFFDDLDNYNLISIAKDLSLYDTKEEYISKSTIDNYIMKGIKEGEYKSLKNGDVLPSLKDNYERGEELIKLKKNVYELLFNKDEDELEEIGDGLSDFISDDIKKDILNRGYNDADRQSYEDELWNKLIDAIGDELGGGYWPANDNDIPKTKGDSIYKWIRTSGKTDSDLAFTIDIGQIIKSVNDYENLYFHIGDYFDWKELVSYIVKEQGSPIDVYLDNVSSYVTKKLFNEAIREL